MHKKSTLTSGYFTCFCRGLLARVFIKLYLRRISGRSSDWNTILLLKEIEMRRSVACPDLERTFVCEACLCLCAVFLCLNI